MIKLFILKQYKRFLEKLLKHLKNRFDKTTSLHQVYVLAERMLTINRLRWKIENEITRTKFKLYIKMR